MTPKTLLGVTCPIPVPLWPDRIRGFHPFDPRLPYSLSRINKQASDLCSSIIHTYLPPPMPPVPSCECSVCRRACCCCYDSFIKRTSERVPVQPQSVCYWGEGDIVSFISMEATLNWRVHNFSSPVWLVEVPFFWHLFALYFMYSLYLLIWTKHMSASSITHNNHISQLQNYDQTRTITWIIVNQTQKAKLLIYCTIKAINVIHIAHLEDEGNLFPILQVAKKTHCLPNSPSNYTRTSSLHLLYWTRVTKCLYVCTTLHHKSSEMHPKQ